MEGLVVGVLTGFVGVGGGFLIIPALVLLGGLPMKQAVGTSLVIIAFKSATGVLGLSEPCHSRLAFNARIHDCLGLWHHRWGYLSRYIDGTQLQKGFGYFVLAVAVFVLINR